MTGKSGLAGKTIKLDGGKAAAVRGGFAGAGAIVGMSALALTLTGFAGSPAYAGGKQLPATFVSHYHNAIELRAGADKAMYENLEKVARFITEHKAAFGHFPEVGTEQDNAVSELESVLTVNPYTVTGVASANEKKPCRIVFMYDMQLGKRLADEAAVRPPSNWRQKPGTITVITNSDGRMLLWAASADGLPLVDHKTYKYMNLYRDLQVDVAASEGIVR